MKRIKSFMIMLGVFAAVSCTKNQTSDCGQVSFDILSDSDIIEVTRSNVSDYTDLPSKEDFDIVIKDASAASVYSGKISGWDSSRMLPSGNYTVSASYGSLEDEGFDKPYFYGTANFAVIGDNITSVSVPVSLGNTVIKVETTADFRNYYKDYNFRLTRNGAVIASFAKDDTRAAFVDGYKITVEGTIASENKEYEFSKDYTNLKEATAYTILFDSGNTGGATITVSFNDTVETIELGDYELND